MNFDKFTIKAQEAVQQAVQRAAGSGHQAITPVHLLSGVLAAGDNVTQFLFGKLGVNQHAVQAVVDSELAHMPRVQGGEPYLDQDSNKVVMAAQDIARSDGDFSNVITIDKGSSSGIALGDTVMVSDGYVGYICELGVNWANVLTVIDSGLSVGAQNVRTKESMICEGDYSLMRKGLLKLSYLTLDTSLFVGDEICTSGLGENVPQGIMIGEVSSISVSPDGATKQAEITPFVDINDLTIVFVITDFLKEG